ncbi:MAG: hypothetical protein CSB55_06890 [Candidatus Cloacimonadota bacterium]|nr:MAG: hypothetical protein CSB55_06890 [Candidatus Cloacimonadota bacterium]
MKYKNMREEELKNKVAEEWFNGFDTSEIIGNIDFSVSLRQKGSSERLSLLWAEAKTGNYDIVAMFAQLILTVGKARTFDKILPPAFLGAFDFCKMAFIPYKDIQDIFYLNDFNWNVTPSKRETKEFKLIEKRIADIIKKKSYVYDYKKDKKELKIFIKNNIRKSSQSGKIKIGKNNFIPVYLRWLEVVKPVIDVNWDKLKSNRIIDADFFLADLFTDDQDTPEIDDDISIRDNLFVVYRNKGYRISKENINQMFDAAIKIKHTDIYQQFWKIYKRPPLKIWHEYIIKRRDLLVPQDIRERKGAFFTPRQWVELSQKYIADVFGEDWQDEYYVWDCAAGTGNLLAGLVNKYNIWASTLDQADVNVMRERIENGANLLKSHIFQFDFLNDYIPTDPPGCQSQTDGAVNAATKDKDRPARRHPYRGGECKLPQSLLEVLQDPEKRKKLIIYINPPYAEAGTTRQRTGTGKNKAGTAVNNYVHEKYAQSLGKAGNELFTQFLMRIYQEIPSCKIANFSKLKNLQSSNFRVFRQNFRAKLEKIFCVPAATFDNVKGKFPIGFFIWDTAKEEIFTDIQADVYDKIGEFTGQKRFSSNDNIMNIGKWLSNNKDSNNIFSIGMMNSGRNDFQNQNLINIQHYISSKQSHALTIELTIKNLIICTIFFAVRLCIKATWINDRDQFLYPEDGWQSDKEFQNDCLAYTLFHGQNRISSAEGTNHWIPFTEREVDAKDKFESNFMTDFIGGKLKEETNDAWQTEILFEETSIVNPFEKKIFSKEAKEVFNAGRKLWRYYHEQPGANPNASFYDIREHFQGRNSKGRMNAESKDATYTGLIADLRKKLKILGKKIEPKIYRYGFLR